MDYSFELNNARKDNISVRDKFHKGRPVVEVFSSLVKGEDITRNCKDGKLADKAVEYIKGLASRAQNNDAQAIAELNALRIIEIEPVLLQEINVLSLFGSYQAMDWGETIYVKTREHVGVEAKRQAEGVDVSFPTMRISKYAIAPVTVSGGYSVNYRELSLGNAQYENEGMEEVRKTIRNKAAMYVMQKIIDSVENADGVKYFYENAGLVQSDVDDLLKKIRRFGKPNVIADYAILSQFIPWVGYSSDVTKIAGISDDLVNELNENGLFAKYRGSILTELDNPYNLSVVKDGNFVPLMPEGVGFVIPQEHGVSAVQTFTQGGLTSFSGNDVTTGEIITRFDLAVAADVVKGREYEIGVIKDSNLASDFE